jgi:hypothetical protein
MKSKELRLQQVEGILEEQKKYFNIQVTEDINFRIKQLHYIFT